MTSTRISIITAVSCIIIAIIAISFMGGEKPQENPRVFGHLPKTINHIELTTPKEQFDLVLQDGYWKIPQRNDYYANSLATLYLLNSFKKAKLTQKVDLKIDTKSFVTIKVFAQDKLITTVDIFDQNHNKYARLDNNIYLVSGLFDLPEDTISWMEQPVLDIAEEHVQFIESNNQKSSRNDYYQPFEGSISAIDTQGLLKIIKYVYFDDVLPQANFPPNGFDNTTQKQIKITTFDGLITELTIYTNGIDYWLSKKLSSAAITRKGVNEYVKSREFLYDGWVFKIPAYYGKGLIEYANTDEGKD